jgi:H+/gluconate symporter-like permease
LKQVPVSEEKTKGGGATNAEEKGDDSGDVIWMAVSIVAMIVFIALFSYLLHKENDRKKQEMEKEGKEASKEKLKKPSK